MADAHEVTEILVAMRGGDQAALPRLLEVVYDEMHRLAERHIRKERSGHTLQRTDMMNEAYVQLVDQRKQDWDCKAHFMAIASTAMRRVLMSYSARRAAEKRGGGRLRITAVDPAAELEMPAEDLLTLNEALDDLAEFDPEGARIVEMRFFGGLTVAEVADVTGIPVRTVERRWRATRAWLKARMEQDQTDES